MDPDPVCRVPPPYTVTSSAVLNGIGGLSVKAVDVGTVIA